MLVAGRGRNYPALTVAVGERMGLIGALAIETARSYLNAREIDGIVIGDGFNRAVVDDFLNELGADPRWRDLPVIVPRGSAIDAERLPNADQFGGDPEAVAAHILPFARMHAFAARLKRVSASLDQKGTLAPETGLLTHAAFMTRAAPRHRDRRGARRRPVARAAFLRDAAEPPRQPRCGAHHQPAAARQRHRLPRRGRLDPDRLHRNRPRHRACGGAADRERAQAHDALARRRAHAARADGRARGVPPARHGRDAGRAHRRSPHGCGGVRRGIPS